MYNICKIDSCIVWNVNCLGRLKELIITAGGENVAPVPIEGQLKNALPQLLSNCMVVGDRRKFLIVLITLKVEILPENLMPTKTFTPEAKKFLNQECCAPNTVDSIDDYLNASPDLKKKIDAVIQKAVDKANEKAVSRAQKMQYFLVIPKDFSLPGGELTPTLKLKRAVVEKMYKKEIDKVYADAEANPGKTE